MKFAIIWSVLFISVFAQNKLIPELKQFEPYLGKTYRGELSEEAGKSVDIGKYERILNGTAVRHTHSLNEGEYGGETIIYYNAENKRIEFYYFTTAGFFTNGYMIFEENKIVSFEKVTGNSNNITEVKALSEIMSDGSISVESMYLKEGKWIKGHSAIYRESPGAEIIFK